MRGSRCDAFGFGGRNGHGGLTTVRFVFWGPVAADWGLASTQQQKNRGSWRQRAKKSLAVRLDPVVNAPLNSNSMVIHNVYFWLKKDLNSEQRSTFEGELRKLAQIPYLAASFIGKPAPTEERPVTDHSFDYSSALHFKTMADHEHYQAGCEHHSRFVQICRPMFERVVVYDYSPM